MEVGIKRSTRAAENGRRTRGLLAATIVGWALIAAPVVVSMMVDSHPGSPEAAVVLLVGLVVPAAIVGLPMSLIFCFFLGDLAWALANRFGLAGKSGALMVGGILGTILYVSWAAAVMLAGRGSVQDGGAISHPPSSRWHLGALLYAIGVGAIGGLTAWAVGTGRSDREPEDQT